MSNHLDSYDAESFGYVCPLCGEVLAFRDPDFLAAEVASSAEPHLHRGAGSGPGAPESVVAPRRAVDMDHTTVAVRPSPAGKTAADAIEADADVTASLGDLLGFTITGVEIDDITPCATAQVVLGDATAVEKVVATPFVAGIAAAETEVGFLVAALIASAERPVVGAGIAAMHTVAEHLFAVLLANAEETVVGAGIASVYFADSASARIDAVAKDAVVAASPVPWTPSGGRTRGVADQAIVRL